MRAGNTIQAAQVVHFDDNAVLAIDELVGRFEVDWREATNVLAEFVAAEPNASQVIGRSYVQKHALERKESCNFRQR